MPRGSSHLSREVRFFSKYQTDLKFPAPHFRSHSWLLLSWFNLATWAAKCGRFIILLLWKRSDLPEQSSCWTMRFWIKLWILGENNNAFTLCSVHTFFSPLSLRSWPLLSCGSAGMGPLECSATVWGDNGHSVTLAYTGAAHGVSVEWQWCVASTEIRRISKCKNSYKLADLWKGHVVASMINATNSRAVMKELVQTGGCMPVMVGF